MRKRSEVFAEQRLGPGFARAAPHRGLLLGLAVAADYRERGMRLPARKLLTRLFLHRSHEAFIAGRVVHVREHEVLPDHQAELVAGLEKGIIFVDHAAVDPQHVQPSRLHLRERSAGRLRRRSRTDDIERRPVRAAAEDRYAVDVQREVAIGGVNCQRPKA